MRHDHVFYLTSRELAQLIPAEDSFILVDQDELTSKLDAGRRRVPFLERNGQYWGLPSSDENAIIELNRLRKAGANFMAFAWPAFWWLDQYSGLHEHLCSNYRCVLKNDRLVVFDLRR